MAGFETPVTSGFQGCVLQRDTWASSAGSSTSPVPGLKQGCHAGILIQAWPHCVFLLLGEPDLGYPFVTSDGGEEG